MLFSVKFTSDLISRIATQVHYGLIVYLLCVARAFVILQQLPLLLIRLQILTYASVLAAFSNEGSFTCHTYCNTGKDLILTSKCCGLGKVTFTTNDP